MAFGGAGYHLVGAIEDGLGAAVVLLEGHYPRPGELLREVKDVVYCGSPERVDGLSVIPDHGEVIASGTEKPQGLRLQSIGVLVFVD